MTSCRFVDRIAAVSYLRTLLSLLLVWTLVCQTMAPHRVYLARYTSTNVYHRDTENTEVAQRVRASVGAGLFAEVSASSGVSGVVELTNEIGQMVIFGPRRFDRTTGPPNKYVEQFALPAGVTSPFTLHIQNGEPNGANRISSAIVKLNGFEVSTPSDLNQNVAIVDRLVSLNSTNTLEVRLASNPGCYLIINISGAKPAEVKDTTPPTLSITLPTDTTTTAAQIDLSGTASDNGTAATGVAHVYVNGLEAVLNQANSTWTITGVPLVMGANQISVRAVDGAGNETTTSVNITRAAPNHPPAVNAGPDQTITLPNTARLNGSTSDDGLSAGSTLTTTWSKVSGPGTVGFGDPNVTVTTAAFSEAGSYVLRLTASDSELSTFDEITITVLPENHAPNANAGADQTITLPNTASLNGSVSDDALPAGSTLAIIWSKVSGPGVVTFASPNATATSVTFSTAGEYVLRLAVSDSELSTTDDVALTVIPQNFGPTANAGPDQSINFPNSANLNGSVSDDGFPAGSSLTTNWSQLSGPSPGLGNATFANPSATVTNVSFSLPGTYVLRLTASDSEFTATDDVQILVTDPRVPPNADFVVPQSTSVAGAFVIASSDSSLSAPERMLDSNTSTVWITPTVSNQFAKFQFFDQEMVFIDRVRLQGPAGAPGAATVRDFEVQVSSTTSNDASFATVLTATHLNNGQLQEFVLPGGPARARFIKFIPKNNYGSGSGIQIATFNPVAVGSADGLISLRGQNNVALAGSPALIANGAGIYRSSYPGGDVSANGLLGYSNGGWSPALATNPFVIIQLAGSRVYTLDGIRISISPNLGFGGAAQAVRSFEVWVSATTPDDSSFIKVLNTTAALSPHLQTFLFPGGPVEARYVKYVPLTNGGGVNVTTQSFDVIAAGVAQVVASSGESGNQLNPAAAAFDSDEASIWYSPNAATTNVWVKTSLSNDKNHSIYGVRIYPVNDFTNGQRGPKDFEIRVSNTTADDNAFSIVYSGTLAGTFNGGPQEFLFPALVEARYVQFFWKNAYTTSNIGVRTLEVLAAPTRGSAIVAFSSQESPARNALDLDASSQWITALNQPTNQWLKLLLARGELATLQHVALQPAISPNGNFSAPRDFELQVSTTDSADTSFTTVLAATLTNSTQLQDFYFAPVQARYVRLLLKTNYGGGGRYGLASFYLYSADQIGSNTRFIDRSTDSDGSIVAWSWDFGDGGTSNEQNPAHTFPAAGDYTVSLTVTDNSGLTSTRQFVYQVVTSTQADFAFSPVIAHEGGETVRFTDTTQVLSDPNTSRRYDFGDGVTLTQATTTSFHQFNDSGTFPVTLRIANPLGEDYAVTKNILVLNMTPTVDIDPGKTVVWGEQWTSVPRINDQSRIDRVSLQGLWDFADGQTSSCVNCTNGNATVTHAYSNPGSYTAVLTITDKDGASASDSAAFTVNKRPVSLALQSTAPTELGQPVLLRVRLMDSFANQPLAGRTIHFHLNGASASSITDTNGFAEVTVTFAAGLGVNTATATFAEEEFYLGGSTYRLLPGAANQQTCTRNSTGTDFWLMFPGNHLERAPGPQEGTFLDISSEVATTGTVTIPGQNVTKPFSVAAHSTTRVQVNSEHTNNDQIDLRGIHLVSQQPVTVYGLNNQFASVDSYLGLPTSSLGNNYLVLAYNNGGVIKGTQFGLVASAAATTVTITPSVTVGSRIAGVPYNLTLNQGQTYMLRDEAGAATDLTGTSIQSDKPVAVFGGHKCANIPAPVSYCDYVNEQLPPVDSWGTHFATMPLATRTKGDTFRFLAAHDNTHVFLNSSRIVTLNRGQHFERIIDGPAEIASNHPILVAQYANSHQYDNLVGDPFMMLIPPLEHYLNAYTVTSLTAFNNNLINVMAPTSDIGAIVIDGTPIPASTFVPIGATGVSGAQLTVSPGTHNLSGSHPFGVYVYGFGLDVSYGYPGSACLSSVLGPTTLILTPKSQKATIDAQSCVTATVKDQSNTPVNSQNVSFTIAGAHPQTPPASVTKALGEAQLCYSAATAGDDLITATITTGNVTSSDTASVSWFPPNQPPLVNAGADQTITLPVAASLSGSAADDGLPSNALTVSWSKVSGPGDATFGHPNAASTTVAFNAAGNYVLRLTASDTELGGTDDVHITVNPAPVNHPPTANAGSDLSATINGNLISNDGNDQPLLNGEIASWTEAQGTGWTQGSPNGDSGFPDAQRGTAYFYSGNGAQAELRQDVDLSAFAANIANGTQQFEFKAYLLSATEALPDSGRVIVEYRDATNTNVIATLDSDEITSTSGWHLTEDTRIAPIGTGWIRVRLIAVRNSGAGNNEGNHAFFDSISLRPLGNAGVRLNGVTTDDGLPYGSALTSIWTTVTGPAVVAFANANAPNSGASFSAPGTYVLRLTSTDGEATAGDDVTVVVNPANQPPLINAGANQTITRPASAELVGTVNDDGQPPGSSVSINWTRASGPGVVTFANAHQGATTVSFSVAGTYLLRLTADDSEYSASDDVTIIVNPAPTAVNQPPVVNPGPSQTISLPTDTVTLNGTATDDGLPAGSHLTINWIRISGPGTVTFGNPNSAVTTAQFSAVGSYVLRLSASDGAYTSFAEVGVILTPQNQPPTANAGTDQSILLSQTAQLNGSAGDDGLATGTLTTTWSKVSGPGQVTFGNPNVTVTGAQFSTSGVYVLRLTANDSVLTASDDVTITVNDNVAPPTAEITSPADGAELTEPTVITGSVSNGNWVLESSLNTEDGADNQVWTVVSSGTGPVTNGSLGTLDTTLMLNGIYSLRLRASDSYGQTGFTSIAVVVDKNFKVGQFQVAFSDLTVPVAGLPIEVIRSYDSRDKRSGDFGVGWQLGIRSARVEKSGVLGFGWFQTVSSGAIPTYCLEPSRPHKVAVTFKDGKVFKFLASTSIHCQQFVPVTSTKLTFAPQPGTHATLEVVGPNDVLVESEGSLPGPVRLLNQSNPDIFNSSTFRLTTAEGAVFVIDQQAGVRSVSDPYGNTLTINVGGIIHSSGKSIVFTRDSDGRITQITDANGNAQSYSYDANGDLHSFTDREQNRTTFTYNSDHHLLSITDARGVELLQNQYDASGRLIGQTDAFNRSLTYDHNVAGRVETMTDRMGEETRYEYDERGNVLRQVDAKGGVKTFTYDALDNVLTETNALGKTTTHTYDGSDNRTSITDPLGNVTRFTYNGARQPLTVTDARGHVTTNTYDAAGTNLLTTTDALSQTTSYTYNFFTGQRTSMRDALNNATAYEYDSAGHLSSETNALGHVTSFTYDANGNRTGQTVTRTNAQNQTESITTTYIHDKLNRLTKTIYPDGSFTLVEYDPVGQQGATIDQQESRTEFTYDDMGRLTRTDYPDGTDEETTYDAEGRRLTNKDRSGRVTSYTYDELGRLTKTTYPDNTSTSTTYDALGQVLITTDARGNATRYEYDDAGRRRKVRSALNQENTFAFDNNGNQLSMTDALGRTTTYQYDANNRRTKTTYADSSFDTVGYDALGRSVSKTDQAGKITQFIYDALGRLTKVKDALNQETTYSYDELGQQLSQTDANNHITRFEYDRLGRRTKRILPLGQFETYAYDSNGNLQSRTDFNGKTTTFNYDSMRRLLLKVPDPSLNQPTVSFTYNVDGQRATMTDGAGVTTYSYDTRSRLVGKHTPFGTLTYSYDEAGNLLTTRSSNANGTSVDYTYDVLNRLATAKDNRVSGLSGGVTSYSYDTVGSLKEYSYPNGVKTSYSYNTLNRLTSMTLGTTASSLGGYSYTLGAAGNRTAVTEQSGRTVSYSYDDLYRLTNETIANETHGINGAVSYGYDSVGNRLARNSSVTGVPSQTSTYDANDRLTSDTYDANGNTKASSGNNYTYDFENRLSSLITHDSSLITFTYDGDGNRVAKTISGVTTNYLVDTNNHTGYAQVVEELQSGSVTKQFTYGHDLISQRCVGVTANCSLSFYGYDGHGSVRLLTNAAAVVTDTYAYDAFGNLISRTGTTSNDYLYSGEQFDTNLGFYYLRARFMNPSSGRFWSMDSYEGLSHSPITLHKYLYANLDPANVIDPSGQIGVAEIIGHVASLSLRVGVFALYSQRLHSTLELVGAAYSLATFVGGTDEERHGTIAAVGGPAAAAGILARQATVVQGVARNIFNIGIATGATSVSVAEMAAAVQTSSGYARDPWRNIIARKGQLLFAGEPNASGFFTTERAVLRSGGDASKLFQGLQVRPFEVEPGVWKYRPGVTVFEVIEDTPAAFGIVKANPNLGGGRYPQVYLLPGWEQKVRPLVTYRLTNTLATPPE
ncbi:MAG: PKD domain-containing protein [Acidobacteriota bacterium]